MSIVVELHKGDRVRFHYLLTSNTHPVTGIGKITGILRESYSFPYVVYSKTYGIMYFAGSELTRINEEESEGED